LRRWLINNIKIKPNIKRAVYTVYCTTCNNDFAKEKN